MIQMDLDLIILNISFMSLLQIIDHIANNITFELTIINILCTSIMLNQLYSMTIPNNEIVIDIIFFIDIMLSILYWYYIIIYLVSIYDNLFMITKIGTASRINFIMIMMTFSIVINQQKKYYSRKLDDFMNYDKEINIINIYLNKFEYDKIIKIFMNKMEYESIDCPICWDQEDLCIMTQCKHIYCLKCFIKIHRNNECPLCRSDFVEVTNNTLLIIKKID